MRAHQGILTALGVAFAVAGALALGHTPGWAWGLLSLGATLGAFLGEVVPKGTKGDEQALQGILARLEATERAIEVQRLGRGKWQPNP